MKYILTFFWGALATSLILLKLLNFIAISWVWVLFPLWSPLALVILALSFLFVVQLGLSIIDKIRKQKRSKKYANKDNQNPVL